MTLSTVEQTIAKYGVFKTQARKAQLRSETAKARRLAEQVSDLSLHTPTTAKRMNTMTESTTIDPGKTRRKQRRASDRPRAAGAQSSFNPLHPSMELPPEQLIRLLGLESKRIRKPKRTHKTPVRNKTATPVTSPASEPQRAEPDPITAPKPQLHSTLRQREYENANAQGWSKYRRNLWVPALAVGIAASVYLFGFQPDTHVATQSPTPAVSKLDRGQVIKSEQKTPTSPLKSKPVRNDPAWAAATNAQAKRLRTEAEQRFKQRLKQTSPPTATPAVMPPAIEETPVLVPAKENSISATPATVSVDPVSVDPVSADPADTAPQTPESLNIDDIDYGEFIGISEFPTADSPTAQPRDEIVLVPVEEPSASTSERLSQENVSELF